MSKEKGETILEDPPGRRRGLRRSNPTSFKMLPTSLSLGLRGAPGLLPPSTHPPEPSSHMNDSGAVMRTCSERRPGLSTPVAPSTQDSTEGWTEYDHLFSNAPKQMWARVTKHNAEIPRCNLAMARNGQDIASLNLQQTGTVRTHPRILRLLSAAETRALAFEGRDFEFWRLAPRPKSTWPRGPSCGAPFGPSC